MKRLLVIAFGVPPTRGPRPGRVWHFARHLPEHGWEAIVLTPRHPRRRVTVEKTREHREYPIPLRRVLDPSGIPYWLQETGYRDVLFSLRQAGRPEEIEPSLPGLYGKESLEPELLALEAPPRPRNSWQRISSWFRCNPDARAGWIQPGLGAARAVCEALAPDAVYSMSPPMTSHRIAMRVAENLRIPWIADLHESPSDAPRNLIDQWRRAHILRGARTFQLPASYDPADLHGAAADLTSPEGPIVLIHAGSTVVNGRDPLMLLNALRHILDAKAISTNRLRVRILGAKDPRLSAAIAERFLSGIVTLEPEVPWEISLETQAEATALLLALGPGDRNRVPDRLMEALTARKPVLAFGRTAEDFEGLIRSQLRAGSVYTDSSSLAGAITDLARAGTQGMLELNAEETDRYHAKRLVEKTLGLLG